MSVSREQFIVDDKGRKTKVVLPIKDYEKLLEDLHDLAVVAERKCEESIPFEGIEKRLKHDGLL